MVTVAKPRGTLVMSIWPPMAEVRVNTAALSASFGSHLAVIRKVGERPVRLYTAPPLLRARVNIRVRPRFMVML